MKIKFIYPKFEKFLETHLDLAELPNFAATWAYTMPPAMGIPILVNMLPADVEWHVEDQNIEPVNFDDDSDLVAVSYFTPQAGYAYRIGDEFLKRGKTVLMGGMHPSMIPEDAASHCTSLCVGEADTVFRRMLDDFSNGGLKPCYRAECFPKPAEIVPPRKGIFDIEDKYDWHASLVSVSRGCPFHCSWCSIPVYQGAATRLRPIDDVVRDIADLAGREFYITDDTIMLNRPDHQQYMTALCDRIAAYDVRMFLSCSPAMNTDPAFLDALARGGAKSIYIVFANDPASSRFYKKNTFVWEHTLSLAKALDDRGIRFFGSFGVGFDCAGEDQFDLIPEFCEKAKVKTAEFFIATPFPGTPFWHQIKTENRLVLHDWNKFNGANVVFRPKQISEQQLRDGFLNLWKQFLSTTDQEEALGTFRQKAENILKSREYSRQVKEAVARGLARTATRRRRALRIRKQQGIIRRSEVADKNIYNESLSNRTLGKTRRRDLERDDQRLPRVEIDRAGYRPHAGHRITRKAPKEAGIK